MKEPSKSRQTARTAPYLRQVSTGLLFFLIVLTGYSQAQNSWQSPSRPNNQNDNQDTIKINVDLVVLHATVQNSDLNPVSGLGKEDFQVYEDGVLQEIESFSHEDIPVTVGLVIDNSGSMRPKRAEVITAAMAFSRASNTEDQIFVVNFNEHVSFGLPAGAPFTNKTDQLEVALSNVAADGMTGLYDAVAAALDHLKKGNRDKQALIVISDGADNASRHNLAQIMDLARRSDAIIYTIGIYDIDDPDRNPGSLKQLAKATGGAAYLPGSVKNIVQICEGIARDIRNQYTITYAPTNINYDGKYRAIQVKARAPDRGRLRVRARAGYYAPLKP
jgi:Ca-activated chloride channel family protein